MLNFGQLIYKKNLSTSSLKLDIVENKLILSNNGKKNLFEPILNSDWTKYITKLSIYSDPYTRWKVKTNNEDSAEEKHITVGKSGYFEFDNQVTLQYLEFIPEIKWKFNQDNTDLKLDSGIKQLFYSELERKESIDNINKNYLKYWEKHEEEQKKYYDLYLKGYGNFIKGYRGVYEQDGYIEPTDIIINYVVKQRGGDEE